MTTQIQPLRPYLAMNRYYICRFDLPWIENLIGAIKGNNKYDRYADGRDLIYEDSLTNGRATSDATIIDINCMKFPVIGLVKKGIERDIFNLFGLIGKRRYYFTFLVGEPEQLSFEQARNEIVDHICSHRWVGQTGGTPAHFRKLQASKKNMAELIDGIAFYGKWPF
jgi:hypothetical protein